ncbi:von Willebrand factor A domain-containing protein 5A-like [Chrysemys picta bellii]|uniref:von Willebrand factor A domain-containing protein 5A-like n=1 Tax=Chrysemys picta bellii TaxID=8478 RepID=UPI0032B30153
MDPESETQTDGGRVRESDSRTQTEKPTPTGRDRRGRRIAVPPPLRPSPGHSPPELPVASTSYLPPPPPPGARPLVSLTIPKFRQGSPRHKVKSCTHGAPPETAPQKERALEESPLLRLVSLQNADGSWDLDPQLAAVLGVSETDARGRMPSKDVAPSVWATVLAVVWLHGRATGQHDEWELLEAKAVGWVWGQAGPQLSECLKAANTLLGCSIGPAVFGL